MGEFGWAYVKGALTASGPTGSLQFRDDQATDGTTGITGSAALIFITGTTIDDADGPYELRLTGTLTVKGDSFLSGNLTVLGDTTTVSASHLIIQDPVIGLGFGTASIHTGAAGDRGLIFGLRINSNQAFIWDETSASFVIGKVGAIGPDKTAYDVDGGDFSVVKVGGIIASGTVGNRNSGFIFAEGGLTSSGDILATGTIGTELGTISGSHAIFTNPLVGIQSVGAIKTTASFSGSHAIFTHPLNGIQSVGAIKTTASFSGSHAILTRVDHALQAVGDVKTTGSLSGGIGYFNKQVNMAGNLRVSGTAFLGHGQGGGAMAPSQKLHHNVTGALWVTSSHCSKFSGSLSSSGEIFAYSLRTSGDLAATGSVSAKGGFSGSTAVFTGLVQAAGPVNISGATLIGHGLVPTAASSHQVTGAIYLTSSQASKFSGSLSSSGEVFGYSLRTSGDLSVSGSVTASIALSGTNLYIPAPSGTLAGGDSYLGVDNTGKVILAAKPGGGRSVAGDTDNGLITWVTSDDTFAAEANASFDGTELRIVGQVSGGTIRAEQSISCTGSLSASSAIFAGSGIQSYGAIKTSGSFSGSTAVFTGLVQAANNLHVSGAANILGGGVTTTPVLLLEADDTLTSGKVISIDHNDAATTSVTPVGIKYDFDKDGVTADTVTSNYRGIQINMADAATNHAGSTVTMKGMDIDVDSANSQGSTTNIGIDLKVTDAAANYGIKLITEDAPASADILMLSDSDNSDYGFIGVTANGAMNIGTVDAGATAANLTFTVDGNISASANHGANTFQIQASEIIASGNVIFASPADGPAITLLNISGVADPNIINISGSNKIGFGTTAPTVAWKDYEFAGPIHLNDSNFFLENDKGFRWGAGTVQVNGNASADTLTLKATSTSILELQDGLLSASAAAIFTGLVRAGGDVKSSGSFSGSSAIFAGSGIQSVGNIKTSGSFSGSSAIFDGSGIQSYGSIKTSGSFSGSSAIFAGSGIQSVGNIKTSGSFSGSSAIFDGSGIQSYGSIKTSGSFSGSTAIFTGLVQSVGDIKTSGSFSGSSAIFTGLVQAADNLHVSGAANILGGGVTTTPVLLLEADDTLTSGKVISIDHNDAATTAVTPVGIKYDFDKDGVTADTVTSNYRGIQINMADAATNHAGSTVIMKGMDIDVDSANSQGTTTNIGIDLKVTDAASNYGIKLITEDAAASADILMLSDTDNADYGVIGVGANGAMNITTVDGGAAAANLTFTVDGNISASAGHGVGSFFVQATGSHFEGGGIGVHTVGGTVATGSLGVNAHFNPTSLKVSTGGGEVVTFGTEDGSDTLAAGKLMCMQNDGVWNYADADFVASSSALIGVALGTAITDGILVRGYFHFSAVQGSFAKGQPCYISETAGSVDFTAPSAAGDVVRVVGYGTDVANVIYICPDSTWIEL